MSKVNRQQGQQQWLDEAGIDTLAIRTGHQRTAQREHSEPIFATSSYVFESAQQAADMFNDRTTGNIYSRFTNPTVEAFESRLGVLESADYCVATASGMAAITGLVLCQLKPGDHVVASREMFGSTISIFNKIFSRFDIDVTLVSLVDPDAWQAATRPATRMLFLETPSNPLGQIADIGRIAGIAHDNEAMLVVDNCFCTPALQQPLELGADVVIHTATKFLDGQGRCVGGAMATNDEQIHQDFFGMMRTTGPSMSPFNAWVFLKGLETLGLRMQKHCDNALQIAQWLQLQEKVSKVFYPGLADHPGHELAKKQQRHFGGVVSFEVDGGREQAWKLINSTRMLSITANLGDTKTTITHPATTTHTRITQAERDQSGITDNLVRVAVGLENVEDVINDLQRGLDAMK